LKKILISVFFLIFSFCFTLKPVFSDYTYGAGDRRSPFLPFLRHPAGRDFTGPDEIEIDVSELSVKGVMGSERENFLLLEDRDSYYIAMEGRLYDEDEEKIPGIAVSVEDGEVLIITDKDEVFKLEIPD